WPMGWAMAVLGFLAIFGGYLQVPGVDHVIEGFLASTFSDSSVFESISVSTASAWWGLLVGGVVSIVGIGLAHRVYVARPGTATVWRERLPAVHSFLVNKWYFDELYDAVVYRPVIAAGGFANAVIERVVV